MADAWSLVLFFILLFSVILQGARFQDCEALLENLRGLKARVNSKMGVLEVPKGPTRLVCPNAISEETDYCDSAQGLVKGQNYVYIEEFLVRPQYRNMQMRIRVEFFTGRHPSNKNILFCYEVPLQVTGSEAEDDEK